MLGEAQRVQVIEVSKWRFKILWYFKIILLFYVYVIVCV